MKRTVLVFVCAFVFVSFMEVRAQLSKAEKKEWKSKVKEFKKNPELLKNLMEERDNLRNKASAAEAKANGLQSTMDDKDSKISELQDDLNRMRGQLASATEAKRRLEADMAASPERNTDYDRGIIFKVQIGSFRDKDLSKYFENHENFAGEIREDGTQAITLGIMRDYWAADTFKKYLREMGVKDAWIVPFRDGQRVELKEVLENLDQ